MANIDDDNLSELVDDDVLEDLKRYPPDEPLGVNDRGVTDVEDSVEERARRELPERGGGRRPDDVGVLVDQSDELGVDDEADAVASEAWDDRREGFGMTALDREEVEPAEEAAMHLTDEPPMGDGDGYLER